jgi:hypothetical protein
MRTLPFAPRARAYLRLYLLTTAIAVSGCGGKKPVYDHESFRPDAPFSKKLAGSGDAVCWSVRRALLSQGYMLERSPDPAVLTGTKDSQPDKDTNITLRLQTTCSDNHDGSSVVFVTATQEVSKLGTMTTTEAAGVGPFTFSWPSGSAKMLGTAKRETVQDPKFYARFFALVQEFAGEERERKLIEEERKRSVTAEEKTGR